jgi:hypothetical protein
MSVKGLCLAGPPRSGETSRLGLRDLVASGVSAGHMVARKARRSRGQEPVQCSGSRPESARGVCGGSLQNRRVSSLSHKTKTGASTAGDGIPACREASMPGGHTTGSRGLRREDEDCGEGVTTR